MRLRNRLRLRLQKGDKLAIVNGRYEKLTDVVMQEHVGTVYNAEKGYIRFGADLFRVDFDDASKPPRIYF